MTPLFDQHSLERWFDHFQSKAENKILVLLQAGGEKFIDIARRNGSYKDQTGNLRSSIGYIIAKNGEVIAENFTMKVRKELIRQPVNIKGVGLQKKSHCLILVVMYW